ncbi:MAG: Veg family protein [Lachnospiraceae bacterium]|jgi:uncharacterized protein Veg|nr:Veg family protein [Lachnospiraceae bacterium]MCR4777216.1 Veg family protein [Lachnospiraceae bacterium]
MRMADLSDVRKAVFRHRGSKVVVRANKGRHKYDVNEGIIKEVYPYIFMLEIKDNDENKMISYSYSDLLTNDVQMTLCS